MEIKDLAKKYKLKHEDFWKHKASGDWILTHNACTRIGNIEGIVLNNIESIYQSETECRFLITMTKEDNTIISVCEANKQNCTSRYLGCMAEKRGRARCVLKLINAYEYGMYSEEESDDFKKENNK